MTSREHLRKPTKAELAEKLARAERELNAYFEWFESESRGEPPACIQAGHGLVLEARGLTRHAGGVVVLRLSERSEDGSVHVYRATPELLDDVHARFAKDTNWEIREAANELVVARANALRG